MIAENRFRAKTMPKMHLFIDTNVFLNFYHYTDDDLKALRTLEFNVFLESIELHLPQQVIDEWERNRERKLLAAIAEFNKQGLSEKTPRFMQDFESAKAYKEAIDKASSARKRLIAEAKANALSYRLEVDTRLKSIFASATVYPNDDDLFGKARRRADRGNPPGKPGSYGDQSNWETLLANVPGTDLYIVTKDGDYKSELGADESGAQQPNPFLKREWSECKGGCSLYVFETIKSLIVHFDKVFLAEANAQADQAAAEQARQAVEEAVVVRDPHEIALKDAAVADLQSGRSFASTHDAIKRLKSYMPLFDARDADRLLGAAVENNQVSLIIDDTDVRDFYLQLLASCFNIADDALVDSVSAMLGIDTLPDEEDVTQDPQADGHDFV